MRQLLKAVRLDRVEAVYLVILRIAVLAVATLCLLAATFFILDGSWRFGIRTDVRAEPTVVDPSEVAAAMRNLPAAPESDGANPISAGVRAAHAAFAKDVFPAYYAVYKAAFDRYHKAEDTLESPQALMAGLGYSLEDYAGGQSLGTKLFVENSDYQQQAQAAVTAAMAAPETQRLLSAYKAAEKSEQQCTTTQTTRRINQICGYYYRYDCSYTQTVPVRRCEAVYPDGIVSPAQAFDRADGAFESLWRARAEANATRATLESAKRHDAKAQIAPKFFLAIQVLGAFLVVMFFFLMIAMERHLRRLASENAQRAETED